MDYLTILEAQSNDTENCSNLFGNVSIVNTKILKLLIEEIKLPVQKVTSCCFAGEKLDQLVITTAVGNPGEEMDLNLYPEAGFIFIANPGVVGKKTTLFGA